MRIALGQCSSAGRKAINQDFHGALHPTGPTLHAKGVVVAQADGISSSTVSREAAETAVKGFLEDYYATPENWSVKRSGQRVINAINCWLHAQTRKGPNRFDRNKGYVCTFSALVIKSRTAHLFHLGDSRVCHLHGERLEPLTEEHRVRLDDGKSYLTRALGISDRLEIDYSAYSVEPGTVLVMMTDGVHEFVDDATIAQTIREQPDELDGAAARIVKQALANGSDDNLTIQIVRVLDLPDSEPNLLSPGADHQPLPPRFHPGDQVDGYEVIRPIHVNARSNLYLAIDIEKGDRVVIKCPSVDTRESPDHIERLLVEEWVARRLDHPCLLKAPSQRQPRSYLYALSCYIEGQTLQQWMHDNPEPELEQVRDIVEQIASGLRAMHRQEILHQDLRPANIMIDTHGRVCIIDFGAVAIAGVSELETRPPAPILGTAPYTAPEYFLGLSGSPRSDLFSLGVITYQMLCGKLPYGTAVAKTKTRRALYRLKYQPLSRQGVRFPDWIDGALRKAVQPDPEKRHEALSEFVHDLRHPNPAYATERKIPLLERNPLRFWKVLSLTLFLAVLALLVTHPALRS
ncbi:MAG: bifunctional protein-serine/threonine kinase/phosphatase [Gammaproteobacteria bacterium]